jgi:sugar lactone lactonase YvrE
MTHRIELFSSQAAHLGEGPVWSATEQALYWIDIGRRTLHRQRVSETKAEVWSLPDYAGCLAEVEPGSVAIAMGSGIHRLELATGRVELLCLVPLISPSVRFNDGKVDPAGRFWVGTMQNNFGPNGQPLPVERFDGCLYRVNDGTAAVMEQEIGISNTLAWSPDASRFYFADTLIGWIWVYDFDCVAAEVRNRRPFFHSPTCGLPDGSAMDVDGCLWNARWDGSAIIRITPDGRLDRIVELPVPRPTSCAFGGRDLGTLFVTSATSGLNPRLCEQFPLSGSVFAIEGLAQGTPVPCVRL